MQDLPFVLLVEDEVLVQIEVEQNLWSGGYNVTTAPTGEDALRLLDASESKYCALVTDINLGRDKVTGWEVAKNAREKEANLPIIYMTGNSADDWTSKGVPNSVLINKPFAPAQILTAVSHLINAAKLPEV